jgi:hypothetical protein
LGARDGEREGRERGEHTRGIDWERRERGGSSSHAASPAPAKLVAASPPGLLLLLLAPWRRERRQSLRRESRRSATGEPGEPAALTVEDDVLVCAVPGIARVRL